MEPAAIAVPVAAIAALAEEVVVGNRYVVKAVVEERVAVAVGRSVDAGSEEAELVAVGGGIAGAREELVVGSVVVAIVWAAGYRAVVEGFELEEWVGDTSLDLEVAAAVLEPKLVALVVGLRNKNSPPDQPVGMIWLGLKSAKCVMLRTGMSSASMVAKTDDEAFAFVVLVAVAVHVVPQVGLAGMVLAALAAVRSLPAEEAAGAVEAGFAVCTAFEVADNSLLLVAVGRTKPCSAGQGRLGTAPVPAVGTFACALEHRSHQPARCCQCNNSPSHLTLQDLAQTVN